MSVIQRLINTALAFYAAGFVLTLAAFVSPNWVKSRHDHDTWGLWQECEFGACTPLNRRIDWYLAVVAFETMGFATAALSVAILLIYIFATTIADYQKRWVLYGCIFSAIVTIALISIGAIILGSMYNTLGGDKDVFGNTVKYDLDNCLIVACVGAGSFFLGILTIVYYLRTV